MKIFSLFKPVSFKGDDVKINNLALNHKYCKEGQYLIVEGSNGLTTYKAFYNQEGKFLFIKLCKHERRKALLTWKLEYDIEKVEKIDHSGNRLLVIRKYVSTSMVTHQLREISFNSVIGNESYRRKFVLEKDKWVSSGQFPKEHFGYWLRRN